MSELNQVLAEQGQQLASEPPLLGAAAKQASRWCSGKRHYD